MMNEISDCEVCGNADLKSVIDLGEHPLCDDLQSIGCEEYSREYPIEILFCQVCFTAHQRFQVNKYDLFPDSYHYRSRFTADVLSGMSALVESCKIRSGSLKDAVVVDIGCNDGSLLDRFSTEGCITVGVEPTDACADATETHRIYKTYFTTDIAKRIVDEFGYPDYVTFTNVFAHIEDLRSLIEALKILLGDKSILVVENHYLGSILEFKQFDTFYHEHPRTYSYKSFGYIAGRLDKQIVDVDFPSRYGGNIRVFIGANDSNIDVDKMNEIEHREVEYPEAIARLQSYIDEWKFRSTKMFESIYAEYGSIPAKAFPGRAAILIKMLGLTERNISAVYEKPGSMKIGYYVPGTHIPIYSDEDLFRGMDLSKPVLNLAWHISSEISSYMKDEGFTGKLIDILGQWGGDS